MQKNGKLSGTISVSGAFALYPLTVRWAEEFKKIHPDVRIDISAGGAGKGMTDVLSNMVDLAMFSRSITEIEVEKGAFAIAVAKDAVVATTSTENPFLQEIKVKGMSNETFKKIFVDADYKYWGEVLAKPSLEMVNVYIRSDACGAAEIWANYLGGNQEDLKGLGVFGDPGIADAVKNDRFGIGFNNLNFAFDTRTGKMYEGIDIIPIDINSNGKIDAEEDFYNSLQDVMNAIKNGSYPSPPARPLYFVSNGKPTNPVVVAFIEFVLSKGQDFIHEAGYIELSKEIEEKELSRIR